MARHLILLGESIFDNGTYVEPGEAEVAKHLKRKVGQAAWTVDLRAVDGAVVDDVEFQLTERPVTRPATFVAATMRSGLWIWCKIPPQTKQSRQC
ncbi:MAG: hypothetical protein ACR2PG_07830 [Hyphomicrobiaceae bacterium]